MGSRRVLVTGASGFIGRHVVQTLRSKNRIVLNDLVQDPDAIIHLAWAGLPNYTDPIHFNNIGWQTTFLKKAVAQGITNITIAGTCLETLETLVPYSIAKLALRAIASELVPDLKWARLWYLYGDGQNEACLLPQLQKAKAMNKKEFSIIDGERDFMEVSLAAAHICRIALQTDVTGIIDCCSGLPESVFSFCSRHVPGIKLKKDYPRPFYEPFSFHGDPSRLGLIH